MRPESGLKPKSRHHPGMIPEGSLGSNPPGMYWDEVSLGWNAYSILKTGHDEHGRFLTELKVIRKHIIENVSNPAARKVLLSQLVDDKSFECFIQKGLVQWQAYAADLIRAVS